MHSNPEEGVLLIEFDDEGREKFLRDIEHSLEEQYQQSGMTDATLTPDEPRGGDWKPNDYYNIIRYTDEEAPLHVDDSVIISGGKSALTDLYNRIRLLPSGSKAFELAAEPSRIRKKRFRFSWLLGAVLCFFFLIPTADRFFVASFNGNDDYWLQMWCYLMIAVAVFPMPRLIILRSVWSTWLNAILGLLSATALMLLELEVFGAPSHYFFMPPLVCHTLLCLFAAIIVTTALCAFFRRGLRRATPTESAKLKLSGKLLFILILNAVLAVALILAALIHGINHCEGQETVAVWHHVVIYVMFFAALSQPLWLMAEVLKQGKFKKICYLIAGLLLIPGLLSAAPVYLFESQLISIDSYAIRIPLALVLISIAISLFFYLRKQILR